MYDYEDMIETIQVVNDQRVLESAADAMTFVKNLHETLKEDGAKLSDEPDVDEIGTVIDHILGELAAVSLFLSEDSFDQVPKMLRYIAEGFERMDDKDFTDPSGETGPSVPKVVVEGFRHFATRIEHTRVQKQHYINQLKKVDV